MLSLVGSNGRAKLMLDMPAVWVYPASPYHDVPVAVPREQDLILAISEHGSDDRALFVSCTEFCQ